MEQSSCRKLVTACQIAHILKRSARSLKGSRDVVSALVTGGMNVSQAIRMIHGSLDGFGDTANTREEKMTPVRGRQAFVEGCCVVISVCCSESRPPQPSPVEL